jgi:hypothetical protein
MVQILRREVDDDTGESRIDTRGSGKMTDEQLIRYLALDRALKRFHYDGTRAEAANPTAVSMSP